MLPDCHILAINSSNTVGKIPTPVESISKLSPSILVCKGYHKIICILVTYGLTHLPDHNKRSVLRHPPLILHVRVHCASYKMTKSNCQLWTFFKGLPEPGVLFPDSSSDTCKDFILKFRINTEKFLEKSKDPPDRTKQSWS